MMDIEEKNSVDEAKKANSSSSHERADSEASTQYSGNKFPPILPKDKRSVSFEIGELRVVLAKMIMVEELPFRTVEQEGFRNFCETMQPYITIPSRFIVAWDCWKVYNEERLKLKPLLKSQRVCLSINDWSSVPNINYMYNYVCITAHWIDNNWNFHKKILNFCQVSSDEEETKDKFIEACLLNWGIDRLFTITVDHASSNNGAIEYVKQKTKEWKGTILEHEFIHSRCCAHFVNLIVEEGLNDLNESILKIRNAIRYVRLSPSSLQTFKACADIEEIESTTLPCLDVETEWNTTYLMLDMAEKFEKAFERLGEDDPEYLLYFKDELLEPPTEHDWKNVRCFVKFLRLFYNLTLRFSDPMHVTSNVFFYELFAVRSIIVQLCKSEDALLSSMAEGIKKKLDKYLENSDNINYLLYVATVLDPRYKLRCMKFCFMQIYDSFMAQKMTDMVSETLTRLYNHYLEHNSRSLPQVSKEAIMDDSEEDYAELLKSQFARYLEEEESVEMEVVRYLKDSCEKSSDSFDVLGWWKLNSLKYPTLSLVARDVLAIPVSTVPLESAFSTDSCVLDHYKSSLFPKMVEVLMCGKNWFGSKPTVTTMEEARKDLETYEEIENSVESLSLWTDLSY